MDDLLGPDMAIIFALIQGPSVEIGLACSRVVSANMNTEQRRQLLVAGAAAGVAAGFNAPISGVFFALEIAQGELVNEMKRSRPIAHMTGTCEAIASTPWVV